MNAWNSYPKNIPPNQGEYIVAKLGFVTHKRYHKVGSPVVKTTWFSEKSPFDGSIFAWSKGGPGTPCGQFEPTTERLFMEFRLGYILSY